VFLCAYVQEFKVTNCLQVYAEFGRITNIPPDTFFTQLDNVLVNLETFFMAKASLHTETDQFHKV